MVRTMLATAILATASLATPVSANDYESLSSSKPVAETMDALVAAVEEAGATVFARIDHAEGARGAGMDLPEAQLLVFGNPKLGTPVMHEDIRAGLMLPLRVLVHDDGGETRILWLEVDDMLDGLDVDEDGANVRAIEDAVRSLTDKAVR